ncbi:YraN family protein [Acinetobacter sp. NCu2D-2]|uniref:YraN family protein n=1 Tax=Acinetobacter sp. NCu2D-2 TaxID=1608473 RepID=UPI0007CDE583|nr:YraN family protein [Acinetobacter sp. NCu2D-2]ANF81420.1 YraN family protein [Acinetobacter sp. NCu2D-2]
MARITQQLGQWAEQQARILLEQHGFHCVAQNFHSRYGELDLVVCNASELIFVEVKARAKTQYASAVESISILKQKKMLKTAYCFLQQHPEFMPYYYRFDVICYDFKQQFAKTIQHDFCNYPYDLQWIENAFTFDQELINL